MPTTRSKRLAIKYTTPYQKFKEITVKLTNKQIISAASGAVRTEILEKGIEFYRFSESQIEAFAAPHPLFTEDFFNGYFGRNCRTTAGVKLDFYTNSKKVKVLIADNELPNGAQLQSFDVYADKKYKGSFRADESFEFTLCGRKKRVSVYFPYFNFPIISGIELDEGAIFEPAGEGVDVLFLGDSITHGASAENTSNTYVSRVSRILDIRILNQGNSGFVYDERIIEKVCEPLLVVCAYGTNDLGRKTLDQIENDTEAFVKKLKNTYNNSKIAAIIPLWTAWDDGKDKQRLAKRAAFKKIYEDSGIFAIDGMKLVPNDPKYFADKVVHPNDEGFRYYASRLSAELEKILE